MDCQRYGIVTHVLPWKLSKRVLKGYLCIVLRGHTVGACCVNCSSPFPPLPSHLLPFFPPPSVDPFTKKDWYDVKAPAMFAVRNIGKTLVTRTQGKSEFLFCNGIMFLTEHWIHHA